MNQRRVFLKTAMAGGALVMVRPSLGAICDLSPRQTKGPFIPDDFPFREPVEGWPFIKTDDSDADLTVIEGSTATANGQSLYLVGQIVDENCLPVSNAKVFLWQADDNGHYNHSEDPNINGHPKPERLLDPDFQYRGVVQTDNDGFFRFKTIKPKYYPLDPNQPHFKRTAHLHIGIMKEGYHDLFTQTYFEGNVLDDIDEIRRLNKIDILLGEWKNQQPTGKINSTFLPLIVQYQERPGVDAPIGNVRLAIRKK